MPVGEGHGAVRIVDGSGNTMQLDTSGNFNFTFYTSGIMAVKLLASGGTPIATNNLTTDTLVPVVVTDFGSFNHALRENGSGWARMRLTESGQTTPMSGIGFKLAVDFSGAVCTASGDVYTVNSGLTVRITNHVGTSGVTGTTLSNDALSPNTIGLMTGSTIYAHEPSVNTMVRAKITASGGSVSGFNNRLVVDFSGSHVRQTNSAVTAPAWLVITGGSGGTNLASATCQKVRLVNLSGNGTMLVGGTGTEAPVSGTKGLALWQPTANVPYLDFEVNNANLLSVVAHTSGNLLSYMTFN